MNALSEFNSDSNETTLLGHLDDDKTGLNHGMDLKKHGYIRYLISAIGMLVTLAIYGMRVVLSVSITTMNKPTNINGTVPSTLNWDSNQQGVVLSAFFWGYMCAMPFAGAVVILFGPKRCGFAAVMTTSIATIASPLVAFHGGYEVFVTLRVVIGIVESLAFPAIILLWNNWAPVFERTKLVTISFMGQFLGLIIFNGISGILVQKYNWKVPFYVSGVCGLIVAVMWAILVSNDPEGNRVISHKEITYIKRSRGENKEVKRLQDVPYKKIVTNAPFLAIVIAHFTERWGFYTMVIELPLYLKSGLKFELGNIGFVTMVPYIILCFFIVASGHLVDFLRGRKHVRTILARKVCTCMAFFFQALFLILTGSSANSTSILIYLTLGVGVGGMTFAGYAPNMLDIAPAYSGVLMSLSNTVASLAGIVSPIVTGALIQNYGVAAWPVVFYIASGMYVIGMIVYGIFASDQVQPWAH